MCIGDAPAYTNTAQSIVLSEFDSVRARFAVFTGVHLSIILQVDTFRMGATTSFGHCLRNSTISELSVMKEAMIHNKMAADKKLEKGDRVD